MELAGSDFHPAYSYGNFLFEQQKLVESKAMLQSALRQEQNDPGLRFALARVLFHDDDIAGAGEVLEKVRESPDCRVHTLLARIYARQKKAAELSHEEDLLHQCRAESTQP